MRWEGITMFYEKLSTARAGVKNFKGTKAINAPMDKVAQALYDPATFGQWLAGLVHVDVLSQQGTTPWEAMPKAFEFYQLYKLQSPIWNRDYVISCHWTLDRLADGEADLFLQSIGRSDHPIKKDRVRGALNLQVYRLKALPDDQGTEVEVEINVDPAGNFPVFIVNLYGSKWCKKTLDALGKTIHNMGA